MQVLVVPCLSDNLSYLVYNKTTKVAFAVDPVSPAKIEKVGAFVFCRA